MALLDAPKVRVHFDRVLAEWTDQPLRSGAEVVSMLDWAHPTVIDGFRAIFQCKDGETIKTLEVTEHGIRAFFMKTDGSDTDTESPELTVPKKRATKKATK